MTVILMIILLLVLVIPHEFGHFITAKMFGVQVNEFSIGMGPLLYQKRRGETLYSIRLFPLGGYCALEGENGDGEKDEEVTDEEILIKQNTKSPEGDYKYDAKISEILRKSRRTEPAIRPDGTWPLPYEEEEQQKAEIGLAIRDEDKPKDAEYNPRAFNNKPMYVKLIILFAGAFMNIVLAIVIMSAVLTYVGYPTTTIDQVMKDSPAQEAGLEAGDKVVKVNGDKVDSWEQIVTAIGGTKEGSKVNLVVERDGKTKDITVTPKKTENGMVVGVAAGLTHNVFTGIVEGTRATWDLNLKMIGAFKDLVHSGVGKDDIAGPVGIANVVQQSAKAGLLNYIYIIAVMSLNLAFINLLPFPALDGGRILFVIIRKFTGNAISDKTEGYVHAIGMLLLIFLLIVITWNDITRIFFK